MAKNGSGFGVTGLVLRRREKSGPTTTFFSRLFSLKRLSRNLNLTLEVEGDLGYREGRRPRQRTGTVIFIYCTVEN